MTTTTATKSITPNRRPAHCPKCGAWIEAGKGNLVRRWNDELDEFDGYDVLCVDGDACKARVETARAEKEASAARVRVAREAMGAIEQRFVTEGVYEPGDFRLVGEEIHAGGGERLYGGGKWFVVEPEGERLAPSAEEIEAARAAHAARVEASRAARAALVAWTAEHLPAHAPTRLSNGGRAPYDGALYGRDLACLSAEDRPAYDALLAETQRLQYTSSPDSVHVTEATVRALKLASQLAAYPRSIWFVVNNGHDGDDWSGNNVVTGGAGAIGRRLPWSAELETEVRAAATELAEAVKTRR